MGNKSSSTIQEYITNSVDFQTDIQTNVNEGNNAGVTTMTNQTLKFTNGGIANCCIYNGQQLKNCQAGTIDCEQSKLGQFSNVQQNVIQQTNSQFSSQVVAQLQATAENDIKNAIDNIQQSDWTNVFGNASKSSVETTVNNAVNDIFQDVTNLNIINTSVNNSFSESDMTVVNCGLWTGEECDWTQDSSINIQVQNILNSIASVAANNSAVVDFYNKIQAAEKTQQSGFWGSLVAMLGKLGAIALLVGLTIFVLFVIIAIFYLIFRKK